MEVAVVWSMQLLDLAAYAFAFSLFLLSLLAFPSINLYASISHI